MLKIQSLTKKFGDKVAVDDLSLHILPGEICGFIGHNGAGKSTTIKCCCGILKPDEGNIMLDGIDVAASPIECKSKIAYLPDNPDLYDFMTGNGYLGFIADIFSVEKEVRKERVERYASILRLTPEELASPISSYSHGMKQKLAIISAFLHQPKLIVMDEPFVGLDPVASHSLKELMREFCKGGGSIFFSTHVLEVAEKLCDNVAIIRGGKLVVYGDTDTVIGDSTLESVFLELQEENDEL